MAFDPRFLVELDEGMRPHQVRLQGGDASSDSFCYPRDHDGDVALGGAGAARRRPRHQSRHGLALRGRARPSGARPAGGLGRPAAAGRRARARHRGGDRGRRGGRAGDADRRASVGGRRRCSWGSGCCGSAGTGIPAAWACGWAPATSRSGRSSWPPPTARVSWRCPSRSWRRPRPRATRPTGASRRVRFTRRSWRRSRPGWPPACSPPWRTPRGYLVVLVLMAALVYERLGLRLLRTAWINLDLVWSIALTCTAVLTVLT